tara:strand:- start:124 stop:1080 length:957 start_codon:yes stop_codon:yes gene_type:complete
MQDNWNNRRVSLMNLNTPLYSSGGSPMAFSVFHSAFAVYGVVDYLGTGGNVVRFYNTGASTSERDFTADELTDGTYTTWLDGASNALTRVAKLYNQLGDSDLDLQHPNASSRPWYEASENTIRFDQAGYFQYAQLFTTTSASGTKVANAFEDNDTTSDTSIVLGARKRDNTLYGLPASARTLFALRDGFSPTYPYNAKHKAISIKSAMYSDDIAVSVRDDNNNFVIEEHDVFDHSTLKTYIAEVERIPASGVTATDMNLFVNNTQEVDTQTTNIGNDISLATINLGDNRYIMKGAMLFNKILTADEKSALHTRMSEDY